MVPLAIHYARPTRVGTAVAVVVGAPFRLPPGIAPRAAQARLTAALEAIETPDGRMPSPSPDPLRWLAAALNLPTVLAMRLAARILADGDNVVLVWAALAGLPVQALWSVAAIGGLLWAGCPWAALSYAAVTTLYAARPARAYSHA